MKVYCITQARMGSDRLPGKVLMSVQGLPLIGYHLARVRQSQKIDKHIIAISDNTADDPLATYLKEAGVCYQRGSELDVLERFYQTAIAVGATTSDLIVRLTGDCPLICPELIDRVIQQHQLYNPAGYSHLSLDEYPRGFDVEVFNMQLLTDARQHSQIEAEREHVTLYLYNYGYYPILAVTGGDSDWSKFRLCVDQIEDFDLISQLVERAPDKLLQADAKSICQTLQREQALAMINQQVAQKQPNKH